MLVAVVVTAAPAADFLSFWARAVAQITIPRDLPLLPVEVAVEVSALEYFSLLLVDGKMAMAAGNGFTQLFGVIVVAAYAVVNIPALIVVVAMAVVEVIGFPFVGGHGCGANRRDD